MVDLMAAPINVSGSGAKVVISGISGQVIQVVCLYFQCNIATTLTIKAGTDSKTGPMSFLASGGIHLPFTSVSYFDCADGEDFVFYFTGLTGQAAGQLFYYQYDPTAV
jgi:hypothetical protein